MRICFNVSRSRIFKEVSTVFLSWRGIPFFAKLMENRLVASFATSTIFKRKTVGFEEGRFLMVVLCSVLTEQCCWENEFEELIQSPYLC